MPLPRAQVPTHSVWCEAASSAQPAGTLPGLGAALLTWASPQQPAAPLPPAGPPSLAPLYTSFWRSAYSILSKRDGKAVLPKSRFAFRQSAAAEPWACRQGLGWPSPGVPGLAGPGAGPERTGLWCGPALASLQIRPPGSSSRGPLLLPAPTMAGPCPCPGWHCCRSRLAAASLSRRSPLFSRGSVWESEPQTSILPLHDRRHGCCPS